MKKLHPLPLTLITTTLVSGVALVYAWTGPTAAPYNNNTAIPVNVGGTGQTKSGSFTSTGLGSAGNLIVTGNTTLGAGTAPRAALDVNGTIITNAGYAQQSTTWYDILGDRIGAARSLYSYGSICTNAAAGDCTGSGGVVIGGANTSANVNITNLGNSFFNVGNVGFGLNSPTASKIHIRSTGSAITQDTALGSYFTSQGFSGNNPYYTYYAQNGMTIGYGSATGGAPSIPTLFLGSTGNASVGTTTNAYKLTVAGTIYSSTGGFRFPDGTTQTTAATGQWITSGSHIYNANTGSVGIGGVPDSNVEFDIIDGTQKLSFLTNRALTGSWPPTAQSTTMTIQSSGSSAGNIAFATGNTEILRITSGGNVGISRTAPTSKLEVGGNTVLFGGAGTSYFSSGAANYIRGNTYFNGVLYDESNAGYYVDPASTSVFSTLNVNSNLTVGGMAYVNNGYGSMSLGAQNSSWAHITTDRPAFYMGSPLSVNGNIGTYNGTITLESSTGNTRYNTVRSGAVGTYDAANTQQVFAMGDAYKLTPGGGSTNYGNFYGIGWSYNPDYGGAGNNPQSKPNLGHQALFMQAGVTGTAIGNGIWSNGIIHSASGGFRFPDGTTQTTAAGTGAFIQNQFSGAQAANGWINGVFQANQVSTNNGSHLSYSGANNYLRGNTYSNGIYYDENNAAYYLDPASTSITNDLRANIFYDQGNTGYYLDPAATSRLATINVDNATVYGNVNINNSSPTYYFQDTDGRSAMLHNNSNQFYILNSAVNNSTTWVANGSYWPLQIDLTTDLATFGGNVNIAEGTLQTSGNVGIRTAPGGHALDVNGDTWTNGWFRTNGNAGWYSESWGGGWVMTDSTWIRGYGGKPLYMDTGLDTGGNSGIGCGGARGGSYMLRVCGAAGVGAAAYYYTSDARLKDNLVPLQDSLSKVRELQGYTFNWKEGGRADVGVIAQEVEKVFPQLVKTDAKGYKSVEYGNLVAPLIEAVKELANKFDALATRVFNLEGRTTNLEKQNEIQAQQIAELQKQINELKNK